jgi:hypothetical protein
MTIGLGQTLVTPHVTQPKIDQIAPAVARVIPITEIRLSLKFAVRDNT